MQAGEEVKEAAIIGTVGSTGSSTLPHLHLEVRKDGVLMDPSQFYTNKED